MSFATDQFLLGADLALLAAAQRGDRASMRKACERFQTPVFALLTRAIGDLERASTPVEGVLLEQLEQLALGQTVADEWAMRLHQRAKQFDASFRVDAPAAGLDGMEAVARVAKRRLIRKTLPSLPLPELTALLLLYHDRLRPADMIGLAGDNLLEVETCLAEAHHRVRRALQESLASGAPS